MYQHNPLLPIGNNADFSISFCVYQMVYLTAVYKGSGLLPPFKFTMWRQNEPHHLYWLHVYNIHVCTVESGYLELVGTNSTYQSLTYPESYNAKDMARSFLRLQKFDLNRVNLLKLMEIQGKRVWVKWIPLYVCMYVCMYVYMYVCRYTYNMV